MKQVLLIIGLCLATTVAFAQKASVTGAERMAKDQRGNLNEARNLINGAKTHADTKDDPKTWFVAGQIEDAQFNREYTKQVVGQQPNEPIMYQALGSSLPLFLQSYELDQRPNAKGKVSPKYTKNIKGIISANHVYYLNGGAHFFENGDYRKAYDFFEQYLDISNLPFFAGEKTAERDENFNTVQFYSAVAAIQLDDHNLAINALNRAKSSNYRQNEVFQFLIFEYDRIKDTVNMEKALEEGYQIFPDSSFYLLSLINLYIQSERNEKALNMINTAISREPSNPQLYHAMGSVYEAGYHDIAKAEENFIKAVQLEADNPIWQSNLGRIYYNQGIEKINDANSITDVQEYNTQREVARDLFKKALPYFEQALKLKSDEFEYMIPLRGIYYQLNMADEFEALNAKIEAR